MSSEITIIGLTNKEKKMYSLVLIHIDEYRI